MKKTCLATMALALSAGTALAADLPARKEAIAPAPPPPLMWTGFYVGLNAGGAWANNNTMNVATAPIGVGGPTGAALWTGSISTGTAGGFIGGGQIGYNRQINFTGPGIVVGLEADIQGVAGSSGTSSGVISAAPIDGGVLTSTMIGRTSLGYIGTARGRIGYLVTPTLLVYGTGGLAYGGVNASLTTYQLNGAVPGEWGGGRTSYSNTQVGWTAGGGVEWMFMPNWSAKAEYLYYDLGAPASTAVSYHFPGAEAADVSRFSTRFNGNIVRAGVNYHFNWGSAPVVASY